ncbi:MAG TPA: ELWxxDGT repeat protein, partial [Thermoanaerobaculia bacterium]|nr:ELWxxDGT repeat protein [Thermoanaerobaculia bacterium]
HRIAGHVSALGALNELAVFGVGEGGDDSEVWATDGTAAGTRRLATLQRTAPGSEPSIVPRNGGGVLLLAWDGHQEEFWRSDGTAAGTHPVPGAELGDNRALASTVLTPAAGLQFFTVVRQPANSNAFSDVELWRTDGTGPGTRVVASFGSHAELDFMTPWGSKVLFIVERPAGCSFWSSDGTAAGTRMIVPSVPGRRCPTAVAALDRSQFIFVARVEAHGGPVPQIFVSDGTPEGTRQISAIRGTRESFNQASPVVSGGFAFLQISGENDTESELWRSDGTATGTFRVFKDLGDAGDLFGYQGFLYFTADDPDGTWHLYQATVRGPGPPVALALSAPPDQSFASLQFTPAHGRLFFIGWDADAGNDLWVTDGTPAGTQRVGSPGSRSSAPDGLVAAGHRIFFSGDDGEHGRELWESDGTPGGTHMVFDLNPGGFSSSPANLAVSGNYLFFSADDGETGVEPWALRLEP